MTKIRPSQTPEAALDRAVGILTRDTASEITDKEPSTLRAYSDPDSDKHISVKDAMKLDLACLEECGEMPFFAMQQLALQSVDFRGRVNLSDALLGVVAGIGKLATIVKDAHAPQSPGGKALTFSEEDTIMKHIDRAQENLNQIRAGLRSNKKAAKEAA